VRPWTEGEEKAETAHYGHHKELDKCRIGRLISTLERTISIRKKLSVSNCALICTACCESARGALCAHAGTLRATSDIMASSASSISSDGWVRVFVSAAQHNPVAVRTMMVLILAFLALFVTVAASLWHRRDNRRHTKTRQILNFRGHVDGDAIKGTRQA
jgi:hypothetical protein